MTTRAEDFDNYLAEARGWETDRLQAAIKSRRTAWIIATASGVLAFTAVCAVAMLTPLKTVEPYVIRVDNSTGIVDVVRSMADTKTSYDEAINKYFLQAYVRHREGYSRALAEEFYNTVGLMSASTEQRRYADYFDPKNPLSPLQVHGDFAKVRVKVKSVSFINQNVALVRYTKEIERGSDRPEVSHWAATLGFKYSGAPMSEKDRAINPLGFQVTEYRNDPDAQVEDSKTVPAGQQRQAPATTAATVVLFPGQGAGAAPATQP